MKILEIKSLVFPEVKLIKYGRIRDNRGYFSEIYKKSVFKNHPDLVFLKNCEFAQLNVSYSKKGVIRGLHFQSKPPISKLVKVTEGRMIDLFLDIRKNSSTFGKIGAIKISSTHEDDFNHWIFVPNDFAHGCCYLEATQLEFFCDGEWNPNSEVSISPFASDIDWSLCDPELKYIFSQIAKKDPIMSKKDQNGLTLEAWKNNLSSEK